MGGEGSRSMVLRLVLLGLFVAHTNSADVLEEIQRQALRTATSYQPGQFPDHTSGAQWDTTNPSGWTAGFFPGLLWELYGATGNGTFKEQAARGTAPLAVNRNNTRTHDVGFMVFDSFGKGIELGGMQGEYEAVVMDAAHSLATRFDPAVGCTQSWPAGPRCRLHPDTQLDFPVIIDNMMNLELLLWAGRHSSNSTLTHMAISHANTTAKHHVRPDGSTYHVVNYDKVSGEVKERCTAQGYLDNSAWSRGQAWCINGFTMVHRYSNQSGHLQTAERCADFFTQKLRLTGSVPLWDFNWNCDMGTHYQDASAAAIAASGLFELAHATMDATKSRLYKSVADGIVDALTSSTYFGDYAKTEGIVMHATGSFMRGSEVDCSLVYGGYYLVEALGRQASLFSS